MNNRRPVISKSVAILTALALVVIAALMAACSSNTPKQYAIKTSASPENAGTVTFSGSGIYDAGTNVEIVASPAPGYLFDYWEGDITGKASTIAVVMDTPKSVVAHFRAKNKYTLNISIDPGNAGTVTPAKGLYDEGTELKLEAAGLPGFIFDYWDGDIRGQSSPTSLVMDRDKNISAHFRQQLILKTIIDPAGAGTVTPATGQYDAGTSVTINATASSGYAFDHWNDTRSDSRNSQSIMIERDTTMTAHFVPLKMEALEGQSKGYLDIQATGTQEWQSTRVKIKSLVHAAVEVNIQTGAIFNPSSVRSEIMSKVVIGPKTIAVKPGETAEMTLSTVSTNPAHKEPSEISILLLSKDTASGDLQTLINAPKFQSAIARVQQLAAWMVMNRITKEQFPLDSKEWEAAQNLLKEVGLKPLS